MSKRLLELRIDYQCRFALNELINNKKNFLKTDFCKHIKDLVFYFICLLCMCACVHGYLCLCVYRSHKAEAGGLCGAPGSIYGCWDLNPSLY